MLINRLAASLSGAKPFAQIAEILGRSEDATLATPGLVRPAVVASLFTLEPRPILVVLAGEETAERFCAPDRCAPRPRARAASARPHRPPVGGRCARPRRRRRSRARALRARQGPPPDRRRLGSRAACARCRLRAATSSTRSYWLTAASSTWKRRLPASRAWATSASSSAEAAGQFAVRGGMLDVYPAGCHDPVRAELFGDEIETLRRYVPSTGQAIGDAELGRGLPLPRARDLLAWHSRRAERALRERGTARALDRARTRASARGRLLQRHRALPAAVLQARRACRPTISARDTLIVVAEPRSLFDDAVRRREELEAAAPHRLLLLTSPHSRGSSSRPRSSTSASGSGSRSCRCIAPARASTPSWPHAAPRSPAARSASSAACALCSTTGYSVALAVPDRRTRRRITDSLADAGVAFVEQRDHVSHTDASMAAARRSGADALDRHRRRRSRRLRHPRRPGRRSLDRRRLPALVDPPRTAPRSTRRA